MKAPRAALRQAWLCTAGFLGAVVALAGMLINLYIPTVSGAAEETEKTQRLIAILRSEAPLFDKARACQQLGELGSEQAVPVLAGLLSAYARSGLEGIPGLAAAAALREAATRLNGTLQAGVVNSLGVLRDAEAVDLLAKLAADPASGVVGEALRALGNIATPASIHVIEMALSAESDESRRDAAAACLLAADRQRAAGDLDRALALYDAIRKAKVPVAFRVGATRGAILAHGADRVPFLLEQLRSEEPAIRNAALLTIREVPDDDLAGALNSELGRSAPDFQEQLLLALADCHNAQSIEAISGLVDSANPESRRTALLVLGRIGSEAATALLAALRKEPAAEEKSVALRALGSMEGPGVDDLLLQALNSTQLPGLQVDLIRLLDSRGVVAATPIVMNRAMGPSQEVRIAALSALKSLGGPGELPVLLPLARSARDPEVRAAAEVAVAGVCGRCGEAACDPVLSKLQQATNPAERQLWIRVLGQVGYPKALPMIEAAAAGADPQVTTTALEQLGHWPNPAPIDTLLHAMETASSPALRSTAVGSVIDLAATAADESQAPEATVVGWLQRANTQTQAIEQKRRILGLLGRLRTTGSFQLLALYLDQPGLKTEAASGIVQIAPALAKSGDVAALRITLEKIAATVENNDLRDRARGLIKTLAPTN